ncbi:MAG TPA: hypothetical protein VGW12_11370 [Pyrinomonadaceae bacterium]|nr:hypothetical protein [Pyrinomonadaceae bacterium]
MTNFRKLCLKYAPAIALILIASAPARTSAQSAAAHQTPSPNGKILFQSTQGSDTYVNEIYTMEADGKRQTRLTYNEFDDTHPLWSPQGNRIAFLADRGAGYDIYLMNPDGSGERPVRDAAHGGPLATDNIEWSPDGTKLLYAVGGKIYVVEVDTDAPVQNLSASAPVYAYDNKATWSPDGSKLAFISYGCAGCFPDLFTMNADGTNRAQLTTTPQAEFEPAWSPNGNQIAYGSFRLNGFSNVFVMNADGTNDHLLNSEVFDAASPVWSPDGTRIAIGSSGPAAAQRRGLYTVSANGSNLTFLTDEANGGRVIWSPDGTRIVTHATIANWVDVVGLDSDGSARHVSNMTKTRKADEFAYSWQRLPTQ